MERAVGLYMRVSHGLLSLVTVAVLLASPLGMLAGHARCLSGGHACRKAVMVERCCCDVLNARSNDPAMLPTVPVTVTLPAVLHPMLDRTDAPPAAAAILRLPDYPPPAGRISLNTLFAVLLI